MDSKPEYNSWYAPIDPFAVMVIGAGTVIFVGVVVEFIRYVRTNLHDTAMFIGALFVLAGFYVLGLVVYHGYHRLF